jgi:hypothetical protein
MKSFLRTLVFLTCAVLISAGVWAQDEKPGAVLVKQRSKAEREAAAKGSKEPSLQEILDHLGYDINTEKDEIRAEVFVKAGKGQVTHKPIAAFGLEKVCTSGWYWPAHLGRSTGRGPKIELWKVDENHNKQYEPPLMQGAKTSFEPGSKPFGLWVSTAGFADETVCTEMALQSFVPRFKADDHDKAHVFPVRRDGKLVRNSYIIGWEYSTNNDDQDIVTIVTNVKPVKALNP